MLRTRIAVGALLTTLLIAQSARAGIFFYSGAPWKVWPDPQALVSGDLNNDGLTDVVVASPLSENVTSFLASTSSSSNYASPRQVARGKKLTGMALGDLNNDGKLDVVVTDQTKAQMYTAMGRGDGAFGRADILEVPNVRNLYGAAIGSFNPTTDPDTTCTGTGLVRDALPDVAVIDRRGRQIVLLMNDGSSPPHWKYGGAVALDDQPSQLLALDMNRDGLTDLVTLNARDETISVALFKRSCVGRAEFETPATFASGTDPSQLVAGDFDNDGTPDLAVISRPKGRGSKANLQADEVDLFFGTGTGSLLPPNRVTVQCPFFANGQSCQAVALAAGDYDGDGKLDLSVGVAMPGSGTAAAYKSDAMQVFAGRGDGSFGSGPAYLIQPGPRSITVGDASGDRRPDLIVGSTGEQGMQAWINASVPGGRENGVQCQSGDECLSTLCIDGVCCGSQCEANEACNIPGRGGVDGGLCVPMSMTALIECDAAKDCPANESFCVEGYCCDTSCDGGTCALPGFEGVCVTKFSNGETCDRADQCSSGFCSGNGRCCQEDCASGYCNEAGVCVPPAANGAVCTEDAQCASSVCDAYDQICCDRRCDENTEFCSEKGVCTLFDAQTPNVTPGVSTPTPTRTPRLTPGPDGEQCALSGECQSGFCVNEVCCVVAQCGANQHCAEGTGQCAAGGTPTVTFTRTPLPTVPALDPCEPNPCPSSQKCVDQNGSAICVATSSSGGCSTTGAGGSGNLLVVAAMPLLFWLGRRWQLQRAVAQSRTRR